MSASVFGHLTRIAWRRFQAPGFLLVVLAVLLFAATRTWSVPTPPGEVDLSAARARQGIWALGAGLCLPGLLALGVGIAGSWRRREADWRGALPLSVHAHLAATLTAGSAAALVATGCLTLAGESRARGEGILARADGGLEHPALVLHDRESARLHLLDADAPFPTEAGLRLETLLAPGAGPAVSLHCRVFWEAGEARASHSESRIFGRSRLQIDVPAREAGRLVLELSRPTDEAGVVLPANSIERLVPASPGTAASRALALRILCAFPAWLCLGIGLAAWMRPALSCLCVLCLQLLPWIGVVGTRWVPAGDALAALGQVGEGLVPRAQPVSAWGMGVLIAVVGWFLAVRGFRDWRSSP